MKHNRLNFLSFWAIFCPFTPLTIQKIKIFKKWKKHLEISSFYKSAQKIMIICYTVPDIWHVTDVIVIFHFGLFLPFIPKSPKNQNSKRMKKTPADIIILQLCTKNHDHILYCSWNMACNRYNCLACNRYNCFSLWVIFLLFYPANSPKNQN